MLNISTATTIGIKYEVHSFVEPPKIQSFCNSYIWLYQINLLLPFPTKQSLALSKYVYKNRVIIMHTHRRLKHKPGACFHLNNRYTRLNLWHVLFLSWLDFASRYLFANNFSVVHNKTLKLIRLPVPRHLCLVQSMQQWNYRLPHL